VKMWLGLNSGGQRSVKRSHQKKKRPQKNLLAKRNMGIPGKGRSCASEEEQQSISKRRRRAMTLTPRE